MKKYNIQENIRNKIILSIPCGSYSLYFNWAYGKPSTFEKYIELINSHSVTDYSVTYSEEFDDLKNEYTQIITKNLAVIHIPKLDTLTNRKIFIKYRPLDSRYFFQKCIQLLKYKSLCFAGIDVVSDEKTILTYDEIVKLYDTWKLKLV